MENKQIAYAFQELAQLMELYDENPFKIRSYQNAYLTLRKLEKPISNMTNEEIIAIKGVGAAIAAKIGELLSYGKLKLLEEYRQRTPMGVIEMLDLPGLGPKKVMAIWKELGIESVGELEYACLENRLTLLKGFGAKKQAEVLQGIAFYQRSRQQYLYAEVEKIWQLLQQLHPAVPMAPLGDFYKKMPVLGALSLVATTELPPLPAADNPLHIPIQVSVAAKADFPRLQWESTNIDELLATAEQVAALPEEVFLTEKAIFTALQRPYIAPEMREPLYKNRWQEVPPENELLQLEQLKGMLHVHTTYSDGIHTLREMALATKVLGYEYLAITDHSQSAFYANGLKPDRLEEQWAAIDALNKELAPFKIFKGIESDILYNGELDYENSLLAKFDFIIASIHSHLKMAEAKATDRLIKAIENPYTTQLGHPTGRLLLAREGYPVAMKKVIDACAANGVSIELNANPRRLDLDWQWLPYALERGIRIAINPDAHSQGQLQYTRYGVYAARKGGLTTARCLNALPLAEFEKAIRKSTLV